jgi:hypothetical protein
MADLKITYDGQDYTLDLDDMDVDQARAMERFGVKNLKTLEEGLLEGDIGCLQVGYWLMMVQNGEPGSRLERMKFKPMMFAKAITIAMLTMLQELEAKLKEEEEANGPKDDEEG